MGLITRCPACGTLFKVVPDQLKISDGWVRCGHCAEIFDASAHLQPAAGASPSEPVPDSAAVPLAEAAPQAGPPPEAEAQDEAGESSASAAAPESAPDTGFESSLQSQLDDGAPLSELDSEQLDAEAKALVEDPLDRPFELRR